MQYVVYNGFIGPIPSVRIRIRSVVSRCADTHMKLYIYKLLRTVAATLRSAHLITIRIYSPPLIITCQSVKFIEEAHLCRCQSRNYVMPY